jgi:hypothetical protein
MEVSKYGWGYTNSWMVMENPSMDEISMGVAL